ncbi:hypothetical protein OIO90_005015 [Microbotryomycetes sp. JL221]|nr:hypothetical protein OIO90_005015 [Microbotryomycetes sp. JL221]
MSSLSDPFKVCLDLMSPSTTSYIDMCAKVAASVVVLVGCASTALGEKANTQAMLLATLFASIQAIKKREQERLTLKRGLTRSDMACKVAALSTLIAAPLVAFAGELLATLELLILGLFSSGDAPSSSEIVQDHTALLTSSLGALVVADDNHPAAGTRRNLQYFSRENGRVQLDSPSTPLQTARSALVLNMITALERSKSEPQSFLRSDRSLSMPGSPAASVGLGITEVEGSARGDDNRVFLNDGRRRRSMMVVGPFDGVKEEDERDSLS